MIPFLITLAVALVIGGFLVSRRGSRMGAALKLAVQTDDVQPLVEMASRLGPSARSMFYQDAIAQLWDSWNRPLAAKLVRAFALEHSDEKICQYWMKQVFDVEPLAAQRWFDEAFVKRHYRPDVAKSCGRSGG